MKGRGILRKEGRMEDKYNPFMILRHTWGKFFGIPEYKDGSVEDYSIFIEIKESNLECYQLKAIKNKTICLYRGYCKGSSWREIKDNETLFNDKESLGIVYIRFKDLPIKIENKVLESFSNYDSFWQYISK